MKPILNDYEKSVNALIPEAVKKADAKVKKWGEATESRMGVDGAKCTWSFWTQFFHEEMNRLAHKAGLRSKM